MTGEQRTDDGGQLMVKGREVDMSSRIESFPELNVYKKAFELQKEHLELFKKCREIGKMLGKMLCEPQKWCARFGDNK